MSKQNSRKTAGRRTQLLAQERGADAYLLSVGYDPTDPNVELGRVYTKTEDGEQLSPPAPLKTLRAQRSWQPYKDEDASVIIGRAIVLALSAGAKVRRVSGAGDYDDTPVAR